MDDGAFTRQDPALSIIAPEDGKYRVIIRDSTNNGTGACNYLLHLGSHPRPTSVYPLGGMAGETVKFTMLGDAGGPFEPADVSDPVLAVGPEGYPAGVTREYYAFVEGYLAKIPVVLGDPAALKLESKALPGYWQSLLDRSRDQSELIRTEMIQDGRLVGHKSLDYRSPVYAVASLSYSRAVNGIAATWLAVWRDAHGDTTRTPKPREVEPRDGPPSLVLLLPPSEEP